MKTLLIALLLTATPALADSAALVCRDVKICEVNPTPACTCPPKPPVKKKPKKKVVPPKKAEAPKPKPEPKKVEEKKDLTLGPRVAVAVGAVKPTNEPGLTLGGEVGLRLRYKRVGAELYADLPNGIGLQGLVYPVLNDDVRLHLNAGLLLSGPFSPPSVDDVPRTFDITVGLGVEVPLGKVVALTADLRMAIPDPVFVGLNGSPVRDANGNQVFGRPGRYLDVPVVLGNSLVETQLMVGLLF